MSDTLIYCSDLTALKTQLKADGYYDEESGSYTVNHTITPLKYNGNTSLSYCRGFALDLDVYTMLEDLGDYDVMFADVNKHNLYKSVYPYDVPIEYLDENNLIQLYNLPKKIGSFA